jgi:hypothetical protein
VLQEKGAGFHWPTGCTPQPQMSLALQRIQQSVLEPGGPQAARIETLWWFLFAVALVV